MIEAQTSIFDKVCAHMKQVHGKAATSDEAIAVFNTVNSWQMNAAIKSQQDERAAQRQLPQDEPPSDKQLKYAEDLGIEIPKGCTKKQLSELIKAKV